MIKQQSGEKDQSMDGKFAHVRSELQDNRTFILKGLLQSMRVIAYPTDPKADCNGLEC